MCGDKVGLTRGCGCAGPVVWVSAALCSTPLSKMTIGLVLLCRGMEDGWRVVRASESELWPGAARGFRPSCLGWVGGGRRGLAFCLHAFVILDECSG